MSELKVLTGGPADRGGYDPIADNLQAWRPVALAMAAAVIGILFVACSDAKPVSYYLAHPKERDAKVQACVGRGSGGDSADCLNAKQAAFQVLGIPAVDGRATPRS
jgi:hypothetical protein